MVLALVLSGCVASQPAGETLNLYGADPLTLDPAISGDATSHEYIAQIFSGLVRLNDSLEPAPDIAERWETSDGGRTYTFFLRRDVKFHNGRAVKAADFKYAWERACNPATGSLTAATYLGDIVGAQEVLAGTSREISGVTVIDDYTLRVTIDAPKSYFLFKLSYPTAFVVDRDNVGSGTSWWRTPNGTGPFRLREWRRGESLVLLKNSAFYGQQAGVAAVDYKILSGLPMSLYEQGQIDVTGVSLEYIDKVSDPLGTYYSQLKAVPELSFYYLGFNMTKPPFDDVNVRRAFSQAVDKEKLVAVVFRGMVSAADGILPPGMPGFNENLTGLGFDPAAAKRLIERSKYGSVANLPEITLTTSGWGGLVAGGLEAIVNEWRVNLGVEVKIRQLEPERFLYHLRQEKDEMFFIGWIADYPHPQDFLDVLFRGGAETNYGEYDNVRVDEILDKANLEQDAATSFALYRQAEQLLVDDAASIPLWFGKNYILVKPYVTGYNLSPSGYATLNTVSVRAR